MRAILIASTVLASCGANVPTSTNQTSELAQQVASHCTDVNAPDLGAGSLCIDNGFRVKTDDFSFTNWGRSDNADANVTVQTLINLFGHASICMPSAETECTLRPTTIQKLEQWNNALAGGRCEGIATLSNRLFLKYDKPEDFAPNAQRASDLQRNNLALDQSIVYWWATQFLSEVSDRAAASRLRSPLQLVDDLIQGLAHGVGYTLALYFGASGHSLTPFAVTHRDHLFVIHVYDNNNPGQRREIIVNESNNSWRFDNALTSIDGTSINWSGATGTMELVPMSARQGPFTCPFCDGDSQDTRQVLTVASRDPESPGYLFIRTRSGKELKATPDAIINAIPGATYEIGKGAHNGVATISLPESTGDFDIFVRRANSAIPAGDVVINFHRAGSADIQVVGNLADTTIEEKSAGIALLAVRDNTTTIHAPAQSNARVSVAAGTTLSRTNLAADASLIVHAIDRSSIDVSLKGAGSSTVANAHFSAANKNAAIESTWILDSDNIFVGSDSPLAPVSVTPHTVYSFTPSKVPRSTTSTTAVPSSIVISRPD